jgi:hypothetical protein
MWIDQFNASGFAGQLDGPGVVKGAAAPMRVCTNDNKETQRRGCSQAKHSYDGRTQLIHAPSDTPLSGPGQRDEEVAHVLLFRRPEVGCR